MEIYNAAQTADTYSVYFENEHYEADVKGDFDSVSFQINVWTVTDEEGFNLKWIEALKQIISK